MFFDAFNTISSCTSSSLSTNIGNHFEIRLSVSYLSNLPCSEIRRCIHICKHVAGNWYTVKSIGGAIHLLTDCRISSIPLFQNLKCVFSCRSGLTSVTVSSDNTWRCGTCYSSVCILNNFIIPEIFLLQCYVLHCCGPSGCRS